MAPNEESYNTVMAEVHKNLAEARESDAGLSWRLARGGHPAAPCDLPRARTWTHSNSPRMRWYFSMYQRFSLLYLGIGTGRTPVPSVVHRHGQFTDCP
jgi:hypothetical protein